MQTKQTGPAMTAASSTGPRLEAGFPGVGPDSKNKKWQNYFFLFMQLNLLYFTVIFKLFNVFVKTFAQ